MAMRREDLRVADVDRGFVADRLKSALDEGRLSLSEYDERLGLTYAAKTYGDLDRILQDLPAVIPPQQSQLAPTNAPGSPAPQGPAAAPSAPSSGAPAPGQPGFAPGQPVVVPGRRGTPRWLLAIWQAWLVAVSINVVIWLLVVVSSGHFVYFWPMWVAGPWGAVLLATTFARLASSGDGGGHPAGPGVRYDHGAAKYDRMAARFERRAERYERRARRRGYSR